VFWSRGGSKVRVKVKALRPFSEGLGASDLTLDRPDGETIEELVRALATEHPEFAKQALEADGSIALTLNLMVSGSPVGEDDLSRSIKDGDEVLMFMPLSGG
jgi:molybdopterin converting factor small subunit